MANGHPNGCGAYALPLCSYTEAADLELQREEPGPTLIEVPDGKGKAVVDFKGIPLEQVGQLVEALAGELSQVKAAATGATKLSS